MYINMQQVELFCGEMLICYCGLRIGDCGFGTADWDMKEWKKWKTRVDQSVKLKAKKQDANTWGNSSKRYCQKAYSLIISTMLKNSYLKESVLGRILQHPHSFNRITANIISINLRLPNGAYYCVTGQ